MSRHTNDTLEQAIWRFTGTDGNSYSVHHNPIDKTFHVFRSEDVEEVTYKNFAPLKDHLKLNGRFSDFQNYFYVNVRDNKVHCDTGPAALVPNGLEIFQPNQDIEHYAIHGKLMSQYSWLTWVKGGPSWVQVMANVLGAKE